MTTAAQQIICPTEEWREYLLRPEFLKGLFDVYDRLRRHTVVVGLQQPPLKIGAQRALTAIRELITQVKPKMKNFDVPPRAQSAHRAIAFNQFASINGPIFDSDEVKVSYVNFLVEGMIPLLENPVSEVTDPAGVRQSS